MKISVMIATSLDGFIARENGSVDWLMAMDDPNPEEDAFTDFMATVDCMVMGRKTMEVVAGFLPDYGWAYEGKRVIVLSKTLSEIPKALSDKAELYSGSLPSLVKMLQEENYQRLYIDGGQTIQSFIKSGLVTDLHITRVPILLGEGVPLFGETGRDIPLKHIQTKALSNGMVDSIYQVIS